MKARWNLGRCILNYSPTQTRNSGFRDSFSINFLKIYGIGIRRQDVKFGHIPPQLVLGLSPSRSYLCIKIGRLPSSVVWSLAWGNSIAASFAWRPQADVQRQTVRKQTVSLQTTWGRWRCWWLNGHMQIWSFAMWTYIASTVSSSFSFPPVQRRLTFAANAVSNITRSHSCHEEEGGTRPVKEWGLSMQRREGKTRAHDSQENALSQIYFDDPTDSQG